MLDIVQLTATISMAIRNFLLENLPLETFYLKFFSYRKYPKNFLFKHFDFLSFSISLIHFENIEAWKCTGFGNDLETLTGVVLLWNCRENKEQHVCGEHYEKSHHVGNGRRNWRMTNKVSNAFIQKEVVLLRMPSHSNGYDLAALRKQFCI